MKVLQPSSTGDCPSSRPTLPGLRAVLGGWLCAGLCVKAPGHVTPQAPAWAARDSSVSTHITQSTFPPGQASRNRMLLRQSSPCEFRVTLGVGTGPRPSHQPCKAAQLPSGAGATTRAPETQKGGQIWGWSLPGCVTLGQLFDLSGPWFFRCRS